MSQKKDKRTSSESDRRLRQSVRFGRILKLLGLIQGSGTWSASALAQELECSTRTVFRDLQVLELAGIPWYHDAESNSYRVIQPASKANRETHPSTSTGLQERCLGRAELKIMQSGEQIAVMVDVDQCQKLVSQLLRWAKENELSEQPSEDAERHR